MIAIIDYGMGNIRSIENAINEMDGKAALVSNPDHISEYDKVILPGVGAFKHAMESLESSGMLGALELYKDSGKLIVGVCLGMQLMCLNSDEGGNFKGLGWFDAIVKHFPKTENIRIPHMGWNEVKLTRENKIFNNIGSGEDFYFVHSYFVTCNKNIDTLGKTNHGLSFSSIIQRDNIVGVQFHPEKSQRAGLQMIKNIISY